MTVLSSAALMGEKAPRCVHDASAGRPLRFCQTDSGQNIRALTESCGLEEC